MPQISIKLDIDVDYVSRYIAKSLSQDDCFNLIAQIDNHIQEYDFTVRLRDHFDKIIEEDDA